MKSQKFPFQKGKERIQRPSLANINCRSCEWFVFSLMAIVVRSQVGAQPSREGKSRTGWWWGGVGGVRLVGWDLSLILGRPSSHTNVALSIVLAPNWTLWRQTSDLSRAMVKPTQFRRWKLHTHTQRDKTWQGGGGEQISIPVRFPLPQRHQR